MYYELRKYDVMPGKLPPLLERFGSFTTKKWPEYGVRVRIQDANCGTTTGKCGGELVSPHVHGAHVILRRQGRHLRWSGPSPCRCHPRFRR